jgi:predicted nucleotidyltransferase component of viral defense system
MTEWHWETVTPPMRAIMQIVGQSDLSTRFYLAGGTALALQLGHRRSIDLGFFSEVDEVRPEMHRQVLGVLEACQPLVVEQAWGNLLLLVQDLHVGFFGYGYRLVAPLLQLEGLSLASVTDIGLMKLDALATRASRKDFYDLYAIAQRISLRDLLDLAPAKYPSVRDFEAMVVRTMVYFDRAEQEAPPALFQMVEWEAVKAFFREQAVVLSRGWLG